MYEMAVRKTSTKNKRERDMRKREHVCAKARAVKSVTDHDHRLAAALPGVPDAHCE